MAFSYLRSRIRRKKSPPRFIPKRIIVHHSLTKDSGSVSWGAIRKYHMDICEWSDIGYHAGVELVINKNNVYYETLVGTIWDKKGSHVGGMNSGSLGICFIGNHDKELPSIQAYRAGAKLIALWLKIYKLSIDDIYPHSAFSDKTCPGKLFDMELLKKYVKNYKEG